MKFKKAVKEIPGEDGWYKKSSEETFNRLAKRLDETLMPQEEIIRLLSDVYWAVSDEYGN